jgi:hypothetical protein
MMQEPLTDVPTTQLRAVFVAGELLILRSLTTMIVGLPLPVLGDHVASIETFISAHPEHREAVSVKYEVYDLEMIMVLLRARRELLAIATRRAEDKDRAARRAARA